MQFRQTLFSFTLRVAVAVCIITQVISLPIAAVSSVKQSFRDLNDILYYEECGGTQAPAEESSGVTGAWVYPTDKSKTQISSEFHEDRGEAGAHRGVDVAGPLGTPIYASRDGTVKHVGSDPGGFGNWIVIQHEVDGKRVDSVYGHMTAQSIKVKPGDKVKGGQQIASIGNEGQSSGPHLHYEEWTGGRNDMGGSGPERKPEAVYGQSQAAPEAEATTDTSESTQSASCCPSGEASGAKASPGGGGGCGVQGYGGGKRNEKANKDQIWSFFKNKGLSDVAIAGIMGNIEQESAFMPDANNGNNSANQGASGGGCRGIVQWCAGRNDNLEKFAKDKGTDWTCLGTQLEFVWHEVTNTGEAGVMKNLNAAKTPGEAGDVWAVEYERMATHEQAGRAERAEAIYKEYTGKDATALGDSGSSSGGAECAKSESNDGSLVSGECSELIERAKKLEKEGKLVLMNRDKEMADIEKCDQVTACPSGGHIGIKKRTLQVLITLAEQGGVPKIPIYALNSDHDCDSGEHGKGLGIDIVLDSSSPEGQKVYKYLYDNAGALGVHKLIYHPTPAGYQCMYDGKPIACSPTYDDSPLSGHMDHIHVSLRE